MRTAAVLPVKRFARAKQRLGASVGDAVRLELARAMVADVLLALRETDALELTIVVTGEPDVAAAARRQGALVVHDEREPSQSAAAALGVKRALEEGFERVLCVPGDCPALDPAELDVLLGSGEDRAHPAEVVIVPDRHGTGTNGLLLTPPDAIAPAFGPDSCERHRTLAAQAGIAVRVERPSSLLLDIDTSADLTALRELLAAHSASAASTRTVLGAPQRADPASAAACA
ncbi:MAG: 2-phospho-L-lactate/phosphoenolpyruvate guanylyltransferase [Solirubrobacteraceae bacterium]|jgi:2-phospho-L-lactate guanylyltransferase|nr:2-phospho-L-lactate/phosphoenolpyruvate guanylyltransferase [Solirubrobacteraceae bacterium]